MSTPEERLRADLDNDAGEVFGPEVAHDIAAVLDELKAARADRDKLNAQELVLREQAGEMAEQTERLQDELNAIKTKIATQCDCPTCVVDEVRENVQRIREMLTRDGQL